MKNFLILRHHLLFLSLAFALFALFSSAPEAKASHAMGGDLGYLHEPTPTAPYRFRVLLYFYRWCDGIAAPINWTLNTQPVLPCAGAVNLTPETMNQIATGVPIKFFPVPIPNGGAAPSKCPNFGTNCGNPSGPFLASQLWGYQAYVEIPSTQRCAQWIFWTTLNARNANIINILNSGSQNLLLEAMVNNLFMSPADVTAGVRQNSPFFSIAPVPNVPVNQRYFQATGVEELDGDSLAFAFDVPKGVNPTTIVPWNNGGTTLVPIPPSGTLPTVGTPRVDPFTGTFSFVPNTTIGQYVYVIQCNEWRRVAGVATRVGYVRRDVQLNVVNTVAGAPPPGTNGLPQISDRNGTFIGPPPNTPPNNNFNFNQFRVNLPACQQTCFDISTNDPDANTQLLLFMNDSIALSNGFTVTKTPTLSEKPSMRYCITPVPAAIRPHPYVITGLVRDDFPLAGETSVAYSLFVVPGNFASAGFDVVKCGPGPVTLQASGTDPLATYSYLWSPATGLSSTTSATPQANPTVNTCYTVRVTNNTNGCIAFDTVCVNLAASLNVTANNGQDTAVLCVNDSVQLIARGASTYSWSPFAGLSDPFIANPIAKPTVTTTYIVTGTSGSCTDTDTITVFVDNPISLSLVDDTTICRGQGVQLNAGGGNSYLWSPNLNISCTTCPNPVVNPLLSTIYTIRAFSQKGCFNQDSVLVSVRPSTTPSVTVSPSQIDGKICLGDTQVLTTNVFQPDILVCGLNRGIPNCSFGTVEETLGQLSGSYNQFSPLGNSQQGVRQQYLVRADELKDLGLGAGDISSLSFFVETVPVNMDSLRNFSIKFKCVNFNEIVLKPQPTGQPLPEFEPGASTAYSAEAVKIIQGQNKFILDNAYYWDGVSNLIVELCYYSLSSTSSDATVFFGNTSFFSSVYNTEQNNPFVCTRCELAGLGRRQSRPLMAFEACEFDPNFYNYDWSAVSSSTVPLTTVDSFITPIPSVAFGKDVRIVPRATGSFDFSLSVTDVFGCASTNVFVNLFVIDSVRNLKIPSDTALCFRDTVLLVVSADSATTFRWSFTNPTGSVVSTNVGDSLFYVGNSPGTLRGIVIADNDNQCFKRDTLLVRVGENLTRTEIEGYLTKFEGLIPNPEDSIQAELLRDISPVGVQFKNRSINLDSIWKWSYRLDGGSAVQFSTLQEPRFIFTEGGRYLVVLISEDSLGCKNRDSILVQVDQFLLPNVITPNGDNQNDTFKILGLRSGSKTKLEVFNRWGRPVFSKEGYENDFDGKGLDPGVYFFSVYVEEQDKTFTGWVQLIK
jgi:gliding motility-associated-like protein